MDHQDVVSEIIIHLPRPSYRSVCLVNHMWYRVANTKNVLQSKYHTVDLYRLPKLTEQKILTCLPSITDLTVYQNRFHGTSLCLLTQLTALNTQGNNTSHLITDNHLSMLTQLKTLKVNCLYYDHDVTGSSIRHLTNLTTLHMHACFMMNDVDLLQLTNLTDLDVSSSSISYKTISRLTDLQRLTMVDNHNIGNKGIKNLTQLTYLDISIEHATHNPGRITLSDNGLKNLTGLTQLDLSSNTFISDKGIRHLTNLTNLDIGYTTTISNRGICQLTKLTNLYCYGNKQVTVDGVKALKKLKTIMIDGFDYSIDYKHMMSIAPFFRHNQT